MVTVKIWTRLRVQARWTTALGADLSILSTEAIHIGTRASHIGNSSAEVWHRDHLLNLAYNRLLTTGRYELTLMCRNCTERAAAETSAMYIYRVANHTPRRNLATTAILRMRSAHIWQIKGIIYLLRCQRCIHRVDNHILFARLLNKHLFCLQQVTLGLDSNEILSKGALISHATLKRV